MYFKGGAGKIILLANTAGETKLDIADSDIYIGSLTTSGSRFEGKETLAKAFKIADEPTETTIFHKNSDKMPSTDRGGPDLDSICIVTVPVDRATAFLKDLSIECTGPTYPDGASDETSLTTGIDTIVYSHSRKANFNKKKPFKSDVTSLLPKYSKSTKSCTLVCVEPEDATEIGTGTIELAYGCHLVGGKEATVSTEETNYSTENNK